jgi:Tol biopolymer transport system component
MPVSQCQVRLTVILVGLMVGLSQCRYVVNTVPAHSLGTDFSMGHMIYVSRCCDCTDTQVYGMTLAGRESTLLPGWPGGHELAWSSDGRWLGALVRGSARDTLRVVDLSTQSVTLALAGSFLQFDWVPDSTGLYYLDSEERLYQYDLLTRESIYLVDGVSNFSVAPSGKWLGLSRRDPAYAQAFTFWIWDTSTRNLLTTSGRQEGYLGSNRSAWSPQTDEVAVIFGPGAAQASKLVLYEVYRDKVEVEARVTARETYQHDYDQDLVSVEFGDLAWSPDGRKLLVVRSSTDVQPGGDLVLFDASLAHYRRLSWGENVTRLVWPTNQWLLYVTNSGACLKSLQGEIRVADMETGRTQVLVTDTLYIQRPVWRPSSLGQ